MALMALLFDILYFSWICVSLPSGVFCSPYSVCAYIAPIMRFLLIFGVIPPPLNMNGTSYAFVFSALANCFSKCLSCFRSCYIILPRYLYSYTCSIYVSRYVILHSSDAMYFVLFMLSSSEYLLKVVSSVCIISYASSVFLAIITMSSAKARIPVYWLPIRNPNCLCSNSLMICLISRLNKIGDVDAPCFTPFWLEIGSYSS